MSLEILAPAGSYEAAVAAVHSGADALYLGQKQFSARANAANFSPQELARTVELCNRSGVKVYQAVNTLVFDREFSALRDCVKTAAGLGVDALIIQDLGAADRIKQWVPEMKLHASTQMSITSADGALFARSLGFERVVLAREMSLKEIREVAQAVDMELEVFVHGALCMCVSGQCYLSAMLGSRSANRGNCAQPCRLPFSTDGKEGYALSLKDLSALESLSALAEAGVTSFKIEGRMKRPEYVGAAVAAVRQKLAGEEPDTERLRKVFSRSGFTNGYLTEHRNKNMFGVRTKEDAAEAHGVLKQIASEYRKPFPHVPLDMTLVLSENAPAMLTVQDEEGNRVDAQGEIPQAAMHAPTDFARAQTSLEKLGGTPYYLRELRLETTGELMLPASVLNALRREACNQMDALRGKGKPKAFHNGVPLPKGAHRAARSPALWVRFAKQEQWENAELSAFERVIVPADVLLGGEAVSVDSEKIIAELPHISFSAEGTHKLLRRLKEQGYRHVLAQTAGDIAAITAEGMQAHGGFSLNCTNSQSLMVLKEHGVQDVVLSMELTAAQSRTLDSQIPLGTIGYGALPLMAVRNCPVRAEQGCDSCGGTGRLTDRKGETFPVQCDGSTAQIYNNRPVYLADRQKELEFADYVVLYFTTETAQQCRSVIEAWRQARSPEGEFTRGLLWRGIE